LTCFHIRIERPVPCEQFLFIRQKAEVACAFPSGEPTVVLQPEANKEVDLPVGHIHNLLDSPLSLITGFFSMDADMGNMTPSGVKPSLLYSEAYKNKNDAAKREHQIKGWCPVTKRNYRISKNPRRVYPPSDRFRTSSRSRREFVLGSQANQGIKQFLSSFFFRFSSRQHS